MPHPKGGYRIDGKRVIGTTTPINRFKDSGGLLYWACEQGKAIERGEIENLYDKRDESAESGTLAHLMVEKFLNNENPESAIVFEKEELVTQARIGFENFLRWWEDTKIEIIAQEIELTSRKHRYGGSPDAIGINSRKEVILLDWKTSNSVYSDYLIQLAAYGNLWDENNPDNPITGGYHLLRFSKENASFAHHFYNDLKLAWEQFKLFLKAYKNDKLLKKMV